MRRPKYVSRYLWAIMICFANICDLSQMFEQIFDQTCPHNPFKILSHNIKMLPNFCRELGLKEQFDPSVFYTRNSGYHWWECLLITLIRNNSLIIRPASSRIPEEERTHEVWLPQLIKWRIGVPGNFDVQDISVIWPVIVQLRLILSLRYPE